MCSLLQIAGMAAQLTSEDDRVRTRGCMLFAQVWPFTRLPAIGTWLRLWSLLHVDDRADYLTHLISVMCWCMWL